MQSIHEKMTDEIMKRIRRLLLEAQMTLGTAESCTGGYIASLITSVSGSSAYFNGAIVSYNNTVKHNLLGVSEDDLNNYGAVSRLVVEQMARGAIKALQCDCAVSTSGIAGPTGGTWEKPVGTVWIAAAVGEKVQSKLFHFSGDRQQNIQQSAEAALLMLEEMLLNI